MPGGFRIRSARAADWPAIWTIMQEVFASGDSYAQTAETSEEDAQAFWCRDGIETFVAEDASGVIGTYALKANQPGCGAHVANAGFMVRVDSSGQGVGTALGEHALQAARAAGFSAMQFNAVVSTNVRAVNLWKRLGFTVVGTVPGAFKHATLGYVDVLIMHREL